MVALFPLSPKRNKQKQGDIHPFTFTKVYGRNKCERTIFNKSVIFVEYPDSFFIRTYLQNRPRISHTLNRPIFVIYYQAVSVLWCLLLLKICEVFKELLNMVIDEFPQLSTDMNLGLLSPMHHTMLVLRYFNYA